METNTAKNFALQLGSLITLYISLTALLILLFGVIDILFPDELFNSFQFDGAQSSIRFSIAMLIVFSPAYIILTKTVNNIRRNEHGKYLGLTKWLIYLSLVGGGGVLLGDMVSVINTFLDGEITTRFIFKALTILVVVGVAFYYYILDARGYWIENKKHSKYFAIVVLFVVVFSLIFGFMNIDTPETVRQQRLDNQQVSDLQDIQFRVENHYLLNKELPENLSILEDEFELPTPATDRSNYEYVVSGESTYELCATFENSSNDNGEILIRKPFSDTQFDWNHSSGRFCFKRIITDLDAPVIR